MDVGASMKLKLFHRANNNFYNLTPVQKDEYLYIEIQKINAKLDIVLSMVTILTVSVLSLSVAIILKAV